MIREAEGYRLRNGWIAVALFMLVVALLGGSSRPDAVQIVALRPLAALVLVPALYFAARDKLADVRTPLFIFLAWALLVLVQLIPLPPSIWQALPGREPVTAMTQALGAEPVWRPLSMVPTRTINVLASMVVPVCALLLAAAFMLRRTTLLLLVVGVGILNALLALLQAASFWNEALYLYAITNSGSAVGIFANQNHSAVFGALTLLALGHLLSDPRSRGWHRWQRLALFAAFLLVLLSALTGGSRAGLLATGLAIVASAAMFWITLDRGKRDDETLPQIFGVTLRPALIFAMGAALAALVVAAFVMFDRIPALRSLTDAGSFDDLRWRLVPALREMMAAFWFLGSGFGSFEEVYHIFEPSELLAPAYVNQAHNDWAQLLIEGGIPAIALVLWMLVWYARRVAKIGGASRQRLAALLFWTALPAILLFASLVDYPLRTPIFQVALVLWLTALCKEELARSDYVDTSG